MTEAGTIEIDGTTTETGGVLEIIVGIEVEVAIVVMSERTAEIAITRGLATKGTFEAEVAADMKRNRAVLTTRRGLLSWTP